MCHPLLFLAFSGATSPALSQAAAANAAGSGAVPTFTGELSTYVTLVGGVLTGVATLLGIPIVRLNQRKTRAEIEKLELESANLRQKTPPASAMKVQREGGIEVYVDNSPGTKVQVLADPRVLAPLLLLLDFVFAWILITLASFFLSIFSLGFLQQLALAALALFLFAPIARQAVHVRMSLRPEQDTDIRQASVKQANAIFNLVYFVLFASSLVFSLVLFSNGRPSFNSVQDMFTWGLATWTGVLFFGFPIARARIGMYLEREFMGQTPPVDS